MPYIYIMIDVIRFIRNYAVHAAVHCSSALGLFNIRLSSVCLMMINVFDRKLTFYFLNTSDGFLRLRPQIHKK